jgi:hypothetical protein
MERFFLGDPAEPYGLGTSMRTAVTVLRPDEFGYVDGQGNLYDITPSWLLNYSNPDVTLGVFVTGRAEAPTADNARQIRGAACLVANYVATQELGAFPSVSSQACTFFTPITFSANIAVPAEGLPGVGPYTVTWFWNLSGYFNASNSNAQLMGTGATLTIPNHKACPRYWVKCVIVSADGVTINRIFRVKLGPNCDCSLPPYDPGGERGAETVTTLYNGAYPNPITGGETLRLATACARYELRDMNGKVVQAYEGGELLSIPTSTTWPTGLYLLRTYQQDGSSQTLKLFIFKS